MERQLTLLPAIDRETSSERSSENTKRIPRIENSF